MNKKTILAGCAVAAVVYIALLSLSVSDAGNAFYLTSLFSVAGAVRLVALIASVPQDSPQRIAQAEVEGGLMALQMLFGFCASAFFPRAWYGVLIPEILLAGAWAGLSLALGSASRTTLAQEAAQKTNVRFWKSLADEVRCCATEGADRSRLTQLEEALRWCDPMSGESLRPLEEEIAQRVRKLGSMRGADADRECGDLLDLMQRRSALCKQAKSIRRRNV